MANRKIPGLLLANRLLKDTAEKVNRLQLSRTLSKEMRDPRLAIILVGDNVSSLSYIRRKKYSATKANIKSRLFQLGAEQSDHGLRTELLELISKLNNDKKYHGILLQLPLPSAICA